MSDPRVRFAPSPTGHLHVGGARTALFNWLFARHHGGAFLLRIEDTDRSRSSEEMTRSILSALEWLGLDPDEGPRHQADGLERHRHDARRVLEAGRAYRCFCQEVAEGAEEAVGGCGGGCRELSEDEALRRAEEGEAHALRFRVPREGATSWTDSVHGATSFENASLEDFVILRSDGTPVYNMAVVSDDVANGITHVIRGDDHVSNTPKQILLYRALAEEPPAFAHVPMILGPDGSRLSKRHGATSVEAYRDRGILPEAMVNFLALLGWSTGDDREVMGREELVEAFTLDGVVGKPGVFDPEKLEWMNGQHIRRASPERLARIVAPRLEEEGTADRDRLERDRERLHRILEAVKDRPRTVDALVDQVRPYYAEEVEYREEAVERYWSDPGEAAAHLEELRPVFAEVEGWGPEVLEAELRGLADRLGVGAGALIHPLRVALTGQKVTPGIFTVLDLMGRERTLARIDQSLEALRRQATGASG